MKKLILALAMLLMPSIALAQAHNVTTWAGHNVTTQGGPRFFYEQPTDPPAQTDMIVCWAADDGGGNTILYCMDPLGAKTQLVPGGGVVGGLWSDDLTNYFTANTPRGVWMRADDAVSFGGTSGSENVDMGWQTSSSAFGVEVAALDGLTPIAFAIVPGAYTNVPTTTSVYDVTLNLSRTIDWDAGPPSSGLGWAGFTVTAAPTLQADGASDLGLAAGMVYSGLPQLGSNVSLGTGAVGIGIFPLETNIGDSSSSGIVMTMPEMADGVTPNAAILRGIEIVSDGTLVLGDTNGTYDEIRGVEISLGSFTSTAPAGVTVDDAAALVLFGPTAGAGVTFLDESQTNQGWALDVRGDVIIDNGLVEMEPSAVEYFKIDGTINHTTLTSGVFDIDVTSSTDSAVAAAITGSSSGDAGVNSLQIYNYGDTGATGKYSKGIDMNMQGGAGDTNHQYSGIYIQGGKNGGTSSLNAITVYGTEWDGAVYTHSGNVDFNFPDEADVLTVDADVADIASDYYAQTVTVDMTNTAGNSNNLGGIRSIVSHTDANNLTGIISGMSSSVAVGTGTTSYAYGYSGTLSTTGGTLSSGVIYRAGFTNTAATITQLDGFFASDPVGGAPSDSNAFYADTGWVDAWQSDAGNINVTLGAAEQVKIDAATTDHTDIGGVLNMDTDTATANVYGINNDMELTADVNGVIGNLTQITSGVAMGSDNISYGNYVSVVANASDSDHNYIANYVNQSGGGTSNFYGYYATAGTGTDDWAFWSDNGMVTYTMGASQNVAIDASTTPHTNITPVLNISTKTSTASIRGFQSAVTVATDVDNVQAGRFIVNRPTSAGTSGNDITAIYVDMSGNASDTNEYYWGIHLDDFDGAGAEANQHVQGIRLGLNYDYALYGVRTSNGDGDDMVIQAMDSVESGATVRTGGTLELDGGDGQNGGTYGTIRMSSPISLRASATYDLANATQIYPTLPLLRVRGNEGGGAATLSGTPSILDPKNDGTCVTIQGTDDTRTVTLQDESNLAGSDMHFVGNADCTLGNKDNVTLCYDLGDDDWIAITPCNNL